MKVAQTRPRVGDAKMKKPVPVRKRMRKNIFARRAEAAFCEVFDDFILTIKESFPEFELETLDAGGKVKLWHAAMMTQLPKGSAKYLKAVKSITDQPANVLHAIAYQDIPAIEQARFFKDMSFQGKVNSGKIKKTLVWDYFTELNKHCFTAMCEDNPVVPTPEEIRENIARRKGAAGSKQAAGQGGGTPVLQEGVREMWNQLLQQRGVEANDDDTFIDTLSKLCGDGSTTKLCTSRDKQGSIVLCRAFPYLDANQPFTSENWEIVNRVFALVTMDTSIPAPMMRGIEKMANSLASDMSSGNLDFSKLNMEKIGRDVLSGVSETDMKSFASNLDKLLPAMQNFNQ